MRKPNDEPSSVRQGILYAEAALNTGPARVLFNRGTGRKQHRRLGPQSESRRTRYRRRGDPCPVRQRNA